MKTQIENILPVNKDEFITLKGIVTLCNASENLTKAKKRFSVN